MNFSKANVVGVLFVSLLLQIIGAAGGSSPAFADSLPRNSVTRKINPFTTDGCSFYPDGNPNGNQVDEWKHCCVIHDLAYWMGGLEHYKIAADQALKECVNKTPASGAGFGQPSLIYLGVLVGGAPSWGPIKNPAGFRWGYGWPNNVRYLPLNHEDLASVKAELEKFRALLDRQVGFNGLDLTPEQNRAVYDAVMEYLEELK